MKTCPNCGATNDDAAQFCNLCLRKFLAPEPAAASVYDGGFGPEMVAAPGQVVPAGGPWDSNYLPPTPPSISISKQKSILLPSAELLSNAFSFYMENMKFYILLSIAISVLVVLAVFSIGGAVWSSVMPIVAAGQPTPQAVAQFSSGLIWSLLALGISIGFFALLGQLAVMIATAEMSKGYELSISAVIFEALKKLGSFVWIAVLQFFLTGGIILVGAVLTVATKGQSLAPMVIGMILGIPVAIVVGTWFSLAAYVYLDQDTRGLAALAASKELIGARWPNVWWRFFVFGLAIAVLQAVPIIGWLINSFVLTPLSAIFPWLLYSNLKYLDKAADY